MPRKAFIKNISISLTPESIQNAIDQVNQLQNDLKTGFDDLCREALELGVRRAKYWVAALKAVDTGALMASIGHGAYDPGTHTGIIYAGGYYAFYVEFGTGIVGAAKPHPAAGEWGANVAVMGMDGSVYTQYDTNGHGESGWWYKPIGGDRYRWTKGMPARPFMYYAYRDLQDRLEHDGGKFLADYIA